MYFLGAISGLSGIAANNQAVGGFVIPPGAKSVYLMPSASGIQFEFFVATGVTGSSFATTLARGAVLEAKLSGPYRCGVGLGSYTVVSVISGVGTASVRVYFSPTS